MASLMSILAWIGSLQLGIGREQESRLSIERLESRIAMSAAGLVDVAGLVEIGTQPPGGLDDKIVFIHGGHGYTADNTGNGAWDTQRPLTLEMVEDLGNKDQMDFFADYLFRAGATVVPLRPIGYQPNEIVLDNDDPQVSFTGDWLDGMGSVFFGDAGDVPYRVAATSSTTTATARYRPSITESGFYPVYTWATASATRTSDQVYAIKHAGGQTQVTINHRRVGNGPIYLGTYHFDAGNTGYVEISNRSNDTGHVVADMIRFGNGMGDIDRGGGVSGLERGDEAGLYWVSWHVSHAQGIPTSEYRTHTRDRTATVSLAPRYAEYMNRAADGRLSDRVFVSFHSNAGSGTGRGVLGLLNGNNRSAAATPNQFLLADTLAQQVNDDLVAQNGRFEHDWFDRGQNVTLDRQDIEFGEINNETIGNEFDATIIETGFHDNTLDSQMLRDPRVRDAIARATYQGLVSYFRSVGNGVPATLLPAAVSSVRAMAGVDGSVTVHWNPPAQNRVLGSAATGYVVYTSANGYAFDGGRSVEGHDVAELKIVGLTAGETYYFRVAARNQGGESPPSEVVTSTAKNNGEQILIVNGFDRLDRTLNPRQSHLKGGQLDRVRPRQSNSFDYVIQLAEALHQADRIASIDSASNESVVANAVDLESYDAVFWILGEESSADDTFNQAEQQQVAGYLAQGGKLFVSGAEIGWDLDRLNNGRPFFENTLRADYVADDAETYRVRGSAAGIFANLRFRFDNGTAFYDVNFPDVLRAKNGSTATLEYVGGKGGTAGIQFSNANQRLILFGFPFEVITSADTRAEIADRVLEFFELESQPVANADFNRDGIVDAGDFTTWRDSLGNSVPSGTEGDADFDGQVTVVDYEIWQAQFGKVTDVIAAERQQHEPMNTAPKADAQRSGRRQRTARSFTPSTKTNLLKTGNLPDRNSFSTR